MYATAAADPTLANATARDNVLVWDRQHGGHYEVWYLTFNHVASRTGYWLRYVIEAPLHGAAYAQVWFGYFDARGAIAGAGHSASWDLSWLPAPATHLLMPRIVYKSLPIGDTRALSPNLDVPIRGTVVVDGRT